MFMISLVGGVGWGLDVVKMRSRFKYPKIYLIISWNSLGQFPGHPHFVLLILKRNCARGKLDSSHDNILGNRKFIIRYFIAVH